jgi:modification methylase
MIEINKIYCMDCLEGMKQLDSESVDLIITSPPYNLGNTHHTGNIRHKAYDDDMPENEYQEWQKNFLIECFRVLKQEGSMLYNHKNRIKKGVQITPYQWILKTPFIIKQEVVWFNRSQNFDKIRFYPMTERVYWLTKSSETKLFNSINHHDIFDTKDWCPEGTDKEHKRAFPVKMVSDLIKCFPTAKIILDPFIGSGTTAIACKQLNCSFIGFEISQEYCDVANKRLEQNNLLSNLAVPDKF